MAMNSRLITIMLVAFSSGAAFGQFSNFDFDAEGWTATGFNSSYALPPSGSSNVSYNAAAGFNGPGIFVTDIFQEVFFSAPAKFLGNKSSAYGSTLTFDSKVTYTDSVDYPMVIIANGTQGLWCRNGSLPIDVWSHVSLNLTPSSIWHFGSPSGPVPTEAEFKQVLSNVTGLYIIAEWKTGPDETYLDNVRLGPAATMTGSVQLQDWSAPAGLIPCELQFRQGSTLVSTSHVTVNSSTGLFVVESLPSPGVYTVAVKASHWLRKLNANIVVTPGGVMNLVSGANGDIDGDDSITVFDYSILSDYFDASSSSANWNTIGGNGYAPKDADIDGDESVSVFDYSLISDHFDQSGDA